MKSGWGIKKLVEVCKFEGGSQPPKSLFSKVKKENYIRLIQIRDYKTDQHVVYIPKNKAKRFCNENEIMIGRYGPPVFQILRGLEGAYNVALMKAIPNEKELLKDYLFLFLKYSKIQDYIISLSERAAGQSGVNKNALEEYPIALPSLLEQRRIIKILNELFEKTTTAKENAEKNLQNARELFESYLQDVFANPSTKLGAGPGEGWEEKTLGEVLEKTETTDPTKNPAKEFIYIDVSSVNKETLSIESTTLMKGKDAPSRARKLIKINDVIFATVRPTLRRIAIIPKEYDGQVCSTGYFVLRAKKHLNNRLVFYFLLTNSFNERMEKLQKGASYPAVTDKDVREQIITYPISPKEQRTIVAKLDALSAETKKLEAIYRQKLADLEELKKSVLQKAFNGELN